jgi:hypothetical protein
LPRCLTALLLQGDFRPYASEPSACTRGTTHAPLIHPSQQGIGELLASTHLDVIQLAGDWGARTREDNRLRGVQAAQQWNRQDYNWRGSPAGGCLCFRVLRSAFFLLKSLTSCSMERTFSGWPFPEALEVQLLNILGQGRLPGLFPGIGQAVELLRIQPQLSGHRDVGIGKTEAPPPFDPGLELFWYLLRHGSPTH